MKRYGTFPVRRNAEGKMLCKWDGKVVPKGRIYFCNKQCAYEVQIRRDGGFLRGRVWERDRGVCAECGIDTEKLKRILQTVRRSLAELLGIESYNANYYWFNREMEKLYSYNTWKNVNAKCEWEADHVVEVVRGGAPYLDNVQTLCTPCHKEKTKRQSRERAIQRRTKGLPLFQETASPCAPLSNVTESVGY